MSAILRFLKNSPAAKLGWLVIGWLLILLSPIVGALPGPGFIIMFPLGLGIVLRNSKWAKKQYLRFKKKFPDYGKWTDWALRRRGQKEMPPIPPIKKQIKDIFGKPKS
ncbi:hypothetical protein LPB140_05845 [Sphingorhabdus lutea]|uniref:Transmembrane protein (PGPGW) n=1 Tax=Sphingorhabdus lutea TaxID=1913578 RepID=A0A1L3JBA1_9SPHN|nr:PGPGW domain-containing protein [Sphingorhabdus lutea]APG62396.1 hypothetical protein LPB140_05845 [Sphingorhabdus lutea]